MDRDAICAPDRVGSWAAILTVLVTATFAVVGVATPARSGPFCATWGCIPAPYTDVARFVPGDYLWLIPGILLVPVFVVLMAAVHASAPEPALYYWMSDQSSGLPRHTKLAGISKPLVPGAA